MGRRLGCCFRDSKEPSAPDVREVADEVRRLMALKLDKAL